MTQKTQPLSYSSELLLNMKCIFLRGNLSFEFQIYFTEKRTQKKIEAKVELQRRDLISCCEMILDPQLRGLIGSQRTLCDRKTLISPESRSFSESLSHLSLHEAQRQNFDTCLRKLKKKKKQ